MKSSLNRFHIVACLITLIIVMGTSLSYGSFSFTLYFAAFSVISFYFLHSFSKGDDFFRTANHESIQQEGAIFLAGAVISSGQAEAKREDRYLEHFSISNLLKRKIFNWLLISTGVYLFHYFHKIPFSFQTTVPFISYLMIINASSVSQLIVIVLLNAGLVMGTYEPGRNLIWYLLYTFLVFLSIAYLSFCREEGFQKTFLQFTKGKRVFSIFTAAAIFCSICIGLSYFLPEKSQKKIKSPESVLDLHRPSLNFLKQSRQDLLKMKKNLEYLQGHKNNQDLLDQIQLQIQKMDQMEVSLRTNGQEQNLQEIIGGSEELISDYEKTLKDVNIDKKTLRINSFKLQDLDQKIGISRTEQDEIKSFLNQVSDNGSSNPDLMKEVEGLKEVLKNANLSDVNREQVTQAITKIADMKSLDELSALKVEKDKLQAMKRDNLAETSRDNIKKMKRDQKERKSWFDKIFQHWKVFLFVLIIFIFQRLLMKKGITTVEVPQPEDLPELKEKWTKMRKRKLSPREEVIIYYNLFHESMQKFHYAQMEAPPSCIISDDMKDFNPDLHKATFAITEIYAQCFYGNRAVAPKTLQIFRKALGKLLKVYGL